MQMRSQLNGLKALIDAVPTITSAQVDAVTTLPPSGAATVGVSFDGVLVHFSSGILRGETGQSGQTGTARKRWLHRTPRPARCGFTDSTQHSDHWR